MLRLNGVLRPRALFLGLVAATLVSLAAPLGARAATTWTVATPLDVPLAPCVGTVCPSLRAAVIAANSGSGGDTIALAGSTTYQLSIPGSDEDAAATGDLDITKPVTITGAGPGSTIIDGGGLDRVFDIQSGAGPVTISGVTIRNGAVFGGPGGGIRTASRLILSNSTLSGNYSDDEGGALAGESASQATLTNVTVDGNSATKCGGITEDEFNNTIEFRDGTISNNSSGRGGGGCEDGDGRLDVINSTVTDNHACDLPKAVDPAGVRALVGAPPNCDGRGVTSADDIGGGLIEEGFGVLTVQGSKVLNNTAFLGGGVVEDGAGTVKVADSALSGNQAAVVAAPASAAQPRTVVAGPDGGGFLEDGDGFVFIDRTLISGNHADRNGGGGATTAANKVQLVNTTVTGNSAGTEQSPGSGGGVADDGFFGGDDIRLIHDTFTNNTAVGGNGGNVDFCTASGCDNARSAGVVQAGNSIFAGGVADGSPNNCSRPLDSLGHNIDSRNDCGFAAAGDRVNTDPLLAALADNGGPTQTQALLAGSPALDAADDTRCPDTDQRGVLRPQGPHCDIGAYETAVPGSATPATITVTAPSQRVAAPGVRVAGPRQCVRSAFHARVRIASRARLLGVRVYLDGRPIYVARQAARRPVRSFSVRIRAGRLGPGLHRITVVVFNAGGSAERTLRFRRCGRARRVSPRFTG